MAVVNQSLFRPNAAAPGDIQTQQAALAQEAAIARALIAQSMEQISPVIRTGQGNPFGTDIPNWGGAVSNAIKGYRGNKQLREINEQQAELAGETQRRSDRDIAEAMAIRRGSPGMAPGSGEEEPVPRVPGNYNASVEALLRSTVPGVKALGAEGFKHMLNPQDVLKEADRYARGTAAQYASGGNADALQPKPILKEAGEAVRPFTEEGVAAGPAVPINTYSPMSKNEAGVVTQRSDVTGKELAIGPQGDISTQKTFDNLDATGQMKAIEDGMKVFQQNQQNLGTMAQIREDMRQVPDSEFGFAGKMKTTVAKLGEALGMTGLTSTSSKEAIVASLGNLTLQKVRLLAPVTQNDVDTIKEILGSEGMTKRALERVVGIMEAATHSEMERYVKQVDKVAPKSSNPAQFRSYWVPEYQPSIVPSGTPANPYKDMDDGAIMRKLRGGG